MPKKQIVMYIASPAQASEFKNRCSSISDEVEIATLRDFGAEPPHDSFLKMSKLMMNGSIDWTVFHWKDVSSRIGGQVFIKELRELIQSGACKRSKTYIIDPDGTLTNKEAFAGFGIGIAKDESAIGMPFAKMLNVNQVELNKASAENSAFEKVSAPDYSGEEGRLPGMDSTTPSSVGRRDSDPFSKISQMGVAGESDPFSAYEGGDTDSVPEQKGMPDTTGEAGASQRKGTGEGDDIFFELADDLGADLDDGTGNGDDLFDDDLFNVLEQAADETIANAADASDPFAAFDYMDNNDILGGADAFANGDPFVELEEKLEAEDAERASQRAAGVSVESVLGGVGGVMNGSSVAEDVVGGQAVLPAGSSPIQATDPFAMFDEIRGDGNAASGEEVVEFDESMFGEPMQGEDGTFDIGTGDEPDEEFDDPYGEMTDEDYAVMESKLAADKGEEGTATSTGIMPVASAGDPFGGRDEVSLDELFDYYGERLGINEYNKLLSMLEPEWDYELEHADGIGLSGGGAGGGLFGSGKKKAGKTYSQVPEYTLADSEYIPEMEVQNGRYAPPDECKIILSSSLKGGSGKTSIAVGIATQLNWYFNKKLMQKMTTSYQSRVLLLSINEFDDIPVHGIGYENFNTANDEDGRNVAELLRRIDDTGGNPSWDDIMHCFVSTEQNRVFYLPSLTQREILEDNINITADDYRRVFEICSKFFQFIVVDTPDVFYQEKNDLMNFVYAVADVICMVVEPDQRSITNLYHFFNGLEVETGRTPLNPAKCMLVVNRYVEKGNPYMVVPINQLNYKDITMSTTKYFSRFACIPFTQPRGTGNIIYGTDPKVKYAFADLTDSVLDMIAQNEAAEDKKKKRRKA